MSMIPSPSQPTHVTAEMLFAVIVHGVPGGRVPGCGRVRQVYRGNLLWSSGAV